MTVPKRAFGDLHEAGYVTFDFERVFPHVFWVSQWSRDTQYPGGYRYKLLFVRDEPADEFELVVLLEARDGAKQEMTRVGGPMSGAREVAAHFLSGLTTRFGLQFEEQDYSRARTLDDFHALTERHGWGMSLPERDA